MKVILYMAITANGMIAKKNNETSWSKDEEKSYFDIVKQNGSLIVGNKTHPLYQDSDIEGMNNPQFVVLTRNKNLISKEKVHYVSSPSEALEFLNGKGIETALVTGGGETNAAFLRANLIDEIFLDIEPFIFGEGIPLFSFSNKELKLEFLDQKMLNKNTIQLHYKVIK